MGEQLRTPDQLRPLLAKCATRPGTAVPQQPDGAGAGRTSAAPTPGESSTGAVTAL